MRAPAGTPICGAWYSEPLVPGDKVSHIWRCERLRAHPGPHASPSHSVSLTMASRTRTFTVDAAIAEKEVKP